MDIVDSHEITEKGTLLGHSDWVTSIVSGVSHEASEDSGLLVTGSRDKSLIVWKLFGEERDGQFGYPYKSLTGHNHFVSDLSLSSDNTFLLSSSWDKTVRLWDLRAQKTSRRFVGHTKEVYSTSFSADNRQIISAGADKGIKLWNTLAECKHTSEVNNHSDWVSCIRYSPLSSASSKDNIQPYFTSVGWDGRLKIWNTNFQIRYSFKAHEGNANSVSISPNKRYIATGGKDKQVHMWDLINLEEPVRSFEAGATVNQIAFNPRFQLVCSATDNGIRIFSISGKSERHLVKEVTHESANRSAKGISKNTPCLSVAWNSKGNKIFGGFADGVIKVWEINQTTNKTEE